MKDNYDKNYIYERIIEENEEKDLNKLRAIYKCKVNHIDIDLLTLKGIRKVLKEDESIKGISSTIEIIEHNKDFYEDLVKYIINKVVNNKNEY